MSDVIVEVKYFGVVTTKFISGIVETDKGERYVANNDTEKGDVLITIDGFKRLVKAKEYADKWRQHCKDDKPKYKKGVTQALIKSAEDLGIKVTSESTKEEVIAAIEVAELEGQGGSEHV